MASKFRSHQCGASSEHRRIIQAEYSDIRREIELFLGFQSSKQLIEPAGAGQQTKRAQPNDAIENTRCGNTGLARTDIANSNPVQYSSAIPDLLGFEQNTVQENPRTNNAQLYSLFDQISSPTQQSQSSDARLLWEVFDSNNILFPVT